jgi:Flp pilus assembly protein TadD
VLTLSKTYMNVNRWADAKDVLQRFLAQKEESAELLGLLGLCFYMLRDDSSAEREWKRALQLDPEETNATAGLEKLKKNTEKAKTNRDL